MLVEEDWLRGRDWSGTLSVVPDPGVQRVDMMTREIVENESAAEAGKRATEINEKT